MTLSAAAIIGLAALTAAAPLTAADAAARTTTATAAVHVVSKSLDGPFGLQFVSSTRLLVAEGDTGEITRIDTTNGTQKILIKGAGGAAGVALSAGRIFVALGGPDESGAPPAGRFPPSSVLVANADGTGARVLADLLAYEKKHNPDGQVQLVKGKPVDALSNPFSMNVNQYGLYVADGGANDVLRVNRLTGAVTTFFVPPTVKSKVCLRPGMQANPGTVGCDPVPTGVAAARGHIYVSTYGAGSPDGSRIYVLNPTTGKIQQIFKGFTGLTGLTVAADGTIYASEVEYGAPPGEGPPPPGFNPAKVGRIVRIAPNGTVTYAQVTMPTGLALNGGKLYASTWSIAGFLGIKHAGQIQQVPFSLFK
jgi:outer membrane protein assembly factor BamB